MNHKLGIPNEKDLDFILPDKNRRGQRAYAVIECFQKIPCDPCYFSCPVKAIREFKDINDLPKIDYEKCTGCGLCISLCPGLAIFLVNESNPDFDVVTLPYEFIPLPKKGDTIWGLNRMGEEICKGEVMNVRKGKHKTTVVTIKIEKEYGNKVRFFKVIK